MAESNNSSFWDTKIGSSLRKLFVIAIVWIPIYFAGESFGGKGIIGCIIIEFVLLIVICKFAQFVKKKRKDKGSF